MAVTNNLGLTLYNENDLFNLVEVENNNSRILDNSLLKMWRGTQEDYEAISHDITTVYFVTSNNVFNVYLGDLPLSATGGGASINSNAINTVYTLEVTSPSEFINIMEVE